MYTVINKSFVRYENNSAINRVEIICDTEQDLPTSDLTSDHIPIVADLLIY